VSEVGVDHLGQGGPFQLSNRADDLLPVSQ
jgi:hypothetical protein